MSKTLSEIREEIDAIDNQVHDLLMRRAALVHSVASAKRKEGLQIVQPAREARMVRRLLSRHRGALPQATVVRIWRELVGSVALLQTGLSVGVAVPDNASSAGSAFWDMARNYFGSVVPMKRINGVNNAISAVSEDEVSFAVLPWPELDEPAPWWVHLFGQKAGDDKMSVICALPYGVERQENGTPQDRALVVSKIAFLPSDDDISFIGLEVSEEYSRAGIMSKAQEAGLEVLNFYSAAQKQRGNIHLHFVEVRGYIEQDSEQIAHLAELFGEQCSYCDVLGGYPAMQELERTKIG